MPKIVIRDLFDSTNIYEFSKVDIFASDGRKMFSIDLIDERTIRIHGGDFCKSENGLMLSDTFHIVPVARNCVEIRKNLYNAKVSD